MTDIRLPGLEARVQYLYDQMTLENLRHQSMLQRLRDEIVERQGEIWEIENGEA